MRYTFTLIEVIMVIVIIGILAVVAVPKFINMRQEARNAANEANIGALRSAASTYYSKTGLDRFGYLCTAAGNPYRDEDYANPEDGSNTPCYPANTAELEGLLVSPPEWGDGEGGACYNATTGAVY